MPRKSVYKFSEQELTVWRKDLTTLLSSLSTNELGEFLEEFLTEEENIMLSKRLQIYKLLIQNIPLKEIQQILGISHETTRLYNHLKNEKSSTFKSLVRKSKSTTMTNENKSSKAANLVELAIQSRSSSKARAKLYQGDLD